MRATKSFVYITMISVLLLSACARNLSSDVYTSDNTLSLTLKGKIISVRNITIKNHDTLSQNAIGTLAGGALGAAGGGSAGKGSGKTVAIIGGAIAGAVIGAFVEDALGTQEGLEYIIEVDTSRLKADYYEGSGAMRNAISSAITSGLITIIQGKDAPLKEKQNVYVIFSDKRTRVIAASN